MKALSKLNECDLIYIFFIVHPCDVKSCKENLVIDRSFDNNMECCMAKERLVGVLNMIPFLDFLGRSEWAAQQRSRSCEDHHQDHK